MISLGIRQMSDPYYQGFAAQLSFYFMLSLVPILLVISQVASIVFKENLEEAFVWILDKVDIANSPVAEILQKLIVGSAAQTSISIIFLFVALWAASKAQFAMMRIANYTFSGGETTGSGFFKERFRAIATISITLLTMTTAVVGITYGGVVIEIIFEFFGIKAVAGTIWLNIRWIVAVMIYFLMISLNYYLLPSSKLKFREIIPGSIFASAGLLIVTMIYSKYAVEIANYNVIYGSLATIIAMLIWFYLMAWVMFLGILVNYVWRETKPGL